MSGRTLSVAPAGQNFYTGNLSNSLDAVASGLDNPAKLQAEAASSYLNQASLHRKAHNISSPIQAFRPQQADAPGEDRHADRNVGLAINKAFGSTAVKYSFGRSAVRGDMCMIGTDNSTSKDSYLVLLNCRTLMENVRVDPAIKYQPVADFVRDVRWITDNVAIAATGEGNVQIYEINAASPSINAVLDTPLNLHRGHIRELAPHPLMPNLIASGGGDQRLLINDINKLGNGDATAPVFSVNNIGGVIGSVRWPVWNQSVCVSVTTDDGTYAMYDTRQPTATAAVNLDTQKDELFAHDRYTDHHVLLGYGDGTIRHIDMRQQTQVLAAVKDPFVEGVGSIEYNAASDAMLVSGYTDFTVWKHDIAAEHSARVWSHRGSGPDTYQNDTGYSTNATWFDEETVLVTDSDGVVSLRVQGFK